MIRCTTCKTLKDKSEYYGRSKRCRDCAKAYQAEWVKKNPGYMTQKRKEWALRNPEKAAEIDRKKYERRKAKQPVKEPRVSLTPWERKKRSLENNPIRLAAMKIYKYAVRHGKLVRGPCAVCGTTEGIDGHHTDYTQPLNVVWLCKPHHREEHRRIKCEAA